MTRTSRSPELAEEEFEARVLAFIPRLRRFLRKLSPNDAEDLLQETLERSLRYRDSFRSDGSLSGWLQRAAFRAWLDHRAREGRGPESLGERDADLAARQGSAESRVEASSDLAERLARLGVREREILLRFHRDGESIREISASLGIPEGTVKSHLHRARRRAAEGPGADDEGTR